MANVRGGICYSRSRRRPWSPALVERGESSVSTKRARRSPSPPPRRVPLRYYSDDDDENNDVVYDRSHGRRDDDDDRHEDEQQSGSEDERDSSRSWNDESSGGSAADDVVESGVVEEQPVAEEEDSDDDRPIRRGSTSTAPATSAPATAPAPASFDSSSVIRDVTGENSSAFDCTICYLPLRSPIFQCKFGHVVCSPCHDKLGQATRCHICRAPTPGGYFRCNAMEQVVSTIRVPCPHAIHGCAEKPVYHDRDAHAQTCAHKPCHCPGEGCGFAGPVQTTLLEHFAAVHGWPCSAGNNTRLPSFPVRLRKGFNVVTAGDTTEEQQYTLVLVNVEHAAPPCNAVTAFCIHPRNSGTVSLQLHYYRYSKSGLCSRHVQTSSLNVVCTDLSNGMPSCFPVLVPKWSATEGEDDDIDIRVTVQHTCEGRCKHI